MFVVEIETKEVNKGEVITTSYLLETLEIKYRDNEVIVKIPNGKDVVFIDNNISKFSAQFDIDGSIYKSMKQKRDAEAWATRNF